MKETNNGTVAQVKYGVCISHEVGNLIEAVDEILSAENAHIYNGTTGEVVASICNGDVNISTTVLRILLSEAYDDGVEFGKSVMRGY